MPAYRCVGLAVRLAYASATIASYSVLPITRRRTSLAASALAMPLGARACMMSCCGTVGHDGKRTPTAQQTLSPRRSSRRMSRTVRLSSRSTRRSKFRTRMSEVRKQAPEVTKKLVELPCIIPPRRKQPKPSPRATYKTRESSPTHRGLSQGRGRRRKPNGLLDQNEGAGDKGGRRRSASRPLSVAGFRRPLERRRLELVSARRDVEASTLCDDRGLHLRLCQTVAMLPGDHWRLKDDGGRDG